MYKAKTAILFILVLPFLMGISAFSDEQLLCFRFHIPRTTALFENMGDQDFSDTIEPQTVDVLKTNGNWMQINTRLGPRWVYLNFAPPTYELDRHLRRFGTNVAVYYKNIQTGFTYAFNPNRVFFGASVPKLYNALYVYTLAERGYISLDTVYTYTWADFWGGTGAIRHMPIGSRLTTRQLLGHSVIDSDNVAFGMLVREYAPAHFSYRDFVREIGANPSFIISKTEKNITARDAAIWAYAIYRYMESDGRYAHLLKEDLMNTAVRFIQADYPVAQKYGWYRQWFHDLAIVYADSPYILIILSNKGGDSDTAHIYNRHIAAHDTFAEISLLIQDFHNKWF